MKKNVIILALFAIFLSACNTQTTVKTDDKRATASAELKSVKVIDNIPYREGNSKSWKLDLAMPENFGTTPRPAIVIVHGGGWRAGSKKDLVYRDLLLDYAFQGYLAISVEYRFDQEAAFPACIEDVKCAVRWLRAHAKEYNVDPDRIGAFGHSAGAHLVLMLAMSSDNKSLEGDGGWNEYSSKINAVVGGSTPTQIGDKRANWNKPEWWPIGYISKNTVPMLLIQGIQDPIVKVDLVDDFVAKMKEAGAPDLSYIRIEGGDHDVAYSDSLRITKPAMDEFFKKYLKN
jgi:dipeptidyl aminopeptidase/acylaminoacyl peptidase